MAAKNGPLYTSLMVLIAIIGCILILAFFMLWSSNVSGGYPQQQGFGYTTTSSINFHDHRL